MRHVDKQQIEQKKYCDRKGTKDSENFNIKEKVWYQDIPKSTWKKGTVIDRVGSRSYKIVWTEEH